MNRDIKFRVWSKENECWLNFGYASIYRKEDGDPDTIFKFDFSDNYIVEQYTDLKDKNGKEIYEGDLVRMYGAVYVTKWREQDFSYIFSRPEIFYWLSIGRSSDCEVIGNIHENPELLGR